MPLSSGVPLSPNSHEAPNSKARFVVGQSKAFWSPQVEALLQLPMHPDTVDDSGFTPLMCASRYGQVDVARLLLEAGAQMDFRDCDDRAALMYAALCGHVDVARLLLESRAQIDQSGLGHGTALMDAACKGHAPVVQLLLEAGADKNKRDMFGQTALMHASNDKTRRLLQEAGVSLDESIGE